MFSLSLVRLFSPQIQNELSFFFSSISILLYMTRPSLLEALDIAAISEVVKIYSNSHSIQIYSILIRLKILTNACFDYFRRGGCLDLVYIPPKNSLILWWENSQMWKRYTSVTAALKVKHILRLYSSVF